MNAAALTDASIDAGEAAILGHQVGVIALAGQHLCHLPDSLLLSFLGFQENSETDVCPI